MANNRTDWRRVAAAAMLTIAMGTAVASQVAGPPGAPFWQKFAAIIGMNLAPGVGGTTPTQGAITSTSTTTGIVSNFSGTDDPHPMSADRVLYALREVAIVCKTAIGHHDREETLTKMAEEIEHIDDFLRLN